MKKARRSLAERFWDKVDKKSSSECWNWTAAKNENGYGIIGKGGRKEGVMRAHILSWEIENSRKLPAGMVICHRCDNRACVNPNHLFADTQKVNMQDCSAKGRIKNGDQRGENNGSAKLSARQVRSIKKSFVPHRMTRKMLAQRYGVSESAIKKIVSGNTWGHI